jgi:alkylhydroperoxidase family enzyme
MTGPDYSTADVAVRDDLRDAHRYVLERLATPGTWWDARQRIAIADESRRALICDLCTRRKAALSPNHVEGEHDSLGILPPAAVEVAHRLRTDPGRLSRAWFDGILTAGLTDGQYVEVVGVVAMTAGLDFFARALGVDPFQLPEPRAGEPSRHRPAGAKGGEAWVPMIAPEDATGAESDIYGVGFVPNIVRALSLVPDEVRTLWRTSAAHYLPVEQIPDPTVRRALDRMQMELIAARVSALNQCFY